MNKTKPLFVTADEIRDDWGVSKAMAYEIIKRMSLQLRKVRNERWQFLKRINHGQLLSGTRIGRVIHVRKERI